MNINDERKEDAGQLRGEIEYLTNRLAMLSMERADLNRMQEHLLEERQTIEHRLEALEVDLDDITTQTALEPEDDGSYDDMEVTE